MTNNQSYGGSVDGQQDQEVSFRGDIVPVINTRTQVNVVSLDELLTRIDINTRKSELRIEAIRYDGEGIDLVKLNSGDVITVETAIALAKEDMLPGYTTGATVNGGRTLRSIPSNDYSIHELPVF